jgi:hypothetical protein
MNKTFSLLALILWLPTFPTNSKVFDIPVSFIAQSKPSASFSLLSPKLAPYYNTDPSPTFLRTI